MRLTLLTLKVVGTEYSSFLGIFIQDHIYVTSGSLSYNLDMTDMHALFMHRTGFPTFLLEFVVTTVWNDVSLNHLTCNYDST